LICGGAARVAGSRVKDRRRAQRLHATYILPTTRVTTVRPTDNERTDERTSSLETVRRRCGALVRAVRKGVCV